MNLREVLELGLARELEVTPMSMYNTKVLMRTSLKCRVFFTTSKYVGLQFQCHSYSVDYPWPISFFAGNEYSLLCWDLDLGFPHLHPIYFSCPILLKDYR